MASDRLPHLLITACKSGGSCSISSVRAAPGAALEMLVEHKLLLIQSVTKVWLQLPKLDNVSLMQKLLSFEASFRRHFDLGHQYGCAMQIVCNQYGIYIAAETTHIKV